MYSEMTASRGLQPSKKKRVLLVDDDPLILSSLRRALRKKQESWEISFVQSGPVALALMKREEPFDVIVTDMRMPVMDGVGLLRRVVERFPGVARIVLTGYAESDDIAIAAELAHQCLAKPCDIDTLVEAINQACQVQEMMSNPCLREVMGGIGNLPAVPSICQKLQAMLQDADVTVRDVASLIESDMGISSRLLRIVNSGFTGQTRTIDTVHDAVVRLGMQHVNDWVLVCHMMHELEQHHWQRYSFENLRRRSVAVGKFARHMALQIGLPKAVADQIMMGGLLHDLGMFLLAARMPEAYAEAFILCERQGMSLHDAEQQVLGVSHGEVGAYLLGLWRFPAAIVEMVLRHHCDKGYDSCSIDVVLVSIADALLPPLLHDVNYALSARLNEQDLAAAGLLEHFKTWQEQAAEFVDGW
ncbi:hypothetical protein WH50_16135 [Pokkaliibacter plantistimulans]|uniref:HDOD domain-containing protein n=2 Tax=Pokkaliibacter plantistimulans TaxID=1635171 RepID=A0ABX5LVR7_9GAMM|nr:hypothetical protein WH50_16135 [Pokkaliibacter plantistimulans]